jgi:hypothetical protein
VLEVGGGGGSGGGAAVAGQAGVGRGLRIGGVGGNREPVGALVRWLEFDGWELPSSPRWGSYRCSMQLARPQRRWLRHV